MKICGKHKLVANAPVNIATSLVCFLYNTNTCPLQNQQAYATS
jgi:16S rRNA A1518/A1519 N6-dimethyltransferase RsmA/KsgA/DIM1 with predicted DNA glycosylase/AP lyase activity